MTLKETNRFSFEETPLAGTFIIHLKPIRDARGFFARSFCQNEMAEMGLRNDFVQCNISHSHKKGTLRGLHYQKPPYQEVKVVTCQRGSIYDVIVDLRKDSRTYGQWLGIHLSADKYQSIYIPEGFAHGFQTLCDDVEVSYLMGNFHHPESATGIRWDSPSLGITWPQQDVIVSDHDRSLPRFTP